MTLATTTNKATYDGDGATTIFPVPFKFFANAHVEAVLRDSTGAETTWTESTEYTLTGAGNDAGGTLTAATSPTNFTPQSGETLVIRRVIPVTQETDYPEGGAFPASAHEDALDLAAMRDQQIQEENERSLRYPVTDSSGISAEIPNSTSRAGKYLAFDAAGNPIAAADPGSYPASAFMGTVLDDVDAATARATLGAQADLAVPSQAEAEAGTATAERVWTSERVGQAVVALAPATTPRAHIAGLTLTNDAPDADHDISVAAGICRNAANADDLTLVSALVKQIDALWAVGTNAGGLDTGAVAADTIYAVWLIKRTDTGVVDALFSTSYTAPTMPTNYDQKRLIGSVCTDASANILQFLQAGDWFFYEGQIDDVTDTTITNSAWETAAISAPPNCLAYINMSQENTTSTHVQDGIMGLRPGDSAAAAWWVNNWQTGTGGDFRGSRMPALLLTDSSSQIDYSGREESGAATVYIYTLGFFMNTRRDV